VSPPHVPGRGIYTYCVAVHRATFDADFAVAECGHLLDPGEAGAHTAMRPVIAAAIGSIDVRLPPEQQLKLALACKGVLNTKPNFAHLFDSQRNEARISDVPVSKASGIDCHVRPIDQVIRSEQAEMLRCEIATHHGTHTRANTMVSTSRNGWIRFHG
jgi:hypothetical protein